MRCQIDALMVDMYIPSDYITNLQQKLEVLMKINKREKLLCSMVMNDKYYPPCSPHDAIVIIVIP